MLPPRPAAAFALIWLSFRTMNQQKEIDHAESRYMPTPEPEMNPAAAMEADMASEKASAATVQAAAHTAEKNAAKNDAAEVA
jgi:hypothetical protein